MKLWKKNSATLFELISFFTLQVSIRLFLLYAYGPREISCKIWFISRFKFTQVTDVIASKAVNLICKIYVFISEELFHPHVWNQRRMYCAQYVPCLAKPFVECKFGSRYRLYVADHEAVTKHCYLVRSAFQHWHQPLILCVEFDM